MSGFQTRLMRRHENLRGDHIASQVDAPYRLVSLLETLTQRCLRIASRVSATHQVSPPVCVGGFQRSVFIVHARCLRSVMAMIFRHSFVRHGNRFDIIMI